MTKEIYINKRTIIMSLLSAIYYITSEMFNDKHENNNS